MRGDKGQETRGEATGEKEEGEHAESDRLLEMHDASQEKNVKIQDEKQGLIVLLEMARIRIGTNPAGRSPVAGADLANPSKKLGRGMFTSQARQTRRMPST